MGKKTNREFKCVTLFTIRQVSTLYFQLFLVQWMSSRNLQRFAKVPIHILLLILFPYLVDHVNRWLLIYYFHIVKSHIILRPLLPMNKKRECKGHQIYSKMLKRIYNQEALSQVNPFLTNFPMLYPLKTPKKPKEGIKWEHWPEMGYQDLSKIYLKRCPVFFGGNRAFTIN